MDQGSIGVEVRPRGKQDREGFTGKRQSGNPEVARHEKPGRNTRCPFCHFATVAANFSAAPQVPNIIPPARVISPPNECKKDFAALFREPRLMSDMAPDSASPLRIPRTVVNDD